MLRSYIYKPDYIDNTIDLDSNAAKELDWMSFWEQLFVKSVNSSLDSFAHLNEELKKEQKSIVFLIDGLEEILKLVFSNKNQQKAIEVLCQGVLNMIAAKYENIGLTEPFKINKSTFLQF